MFQVSNVSIKEKVNPEEEEFFAHELHDLVPDSNNADIEIYPIQKSSRSLVKDKLGREHYERFCSGSLRLVLHAVNFEPSSVQNHMNDLLPMMTAQAKAGKGIAFLKVDNGPDWCLINIVNKIYFCCLWRASSLDILAICSYAARYSACSNIEHSWSLMIKKLVNVILPSILEGNDEPPYKQMELSKEEIADKEKLILYHFFILISTYNTFWIELNFAISHFVNQVSGTHKELDSQKSCAGW